MKANQAINRRRASIKETGEELSPEEWARFDAAIAEMRAERARQQLANLELGFTLCRLPDRHGGYSTSSQ